MSTPGPPPTPESADARTAAASTPTGGSASNPPGRWTAIAAAVGAPVALIAGAVIYGEWAPDVHHLVRIELGRAPLTSHLPAALGWDLLFILGYGSALALGLWCADQTLFRGRHAPTAGWIVRWTGWTGVVVVVLGDLLEDLFLYLGTRQPAGSGARTRLVEVASACSTVKWSVLIPVAALAAVGVFVTVGRLVVNRPGRLGKVAEQGGSLLDDGYVAPLRDALDEAQPAPYNAQWRAGYRIPGEREIVAEHLDTGIVGVCLSGGGVRAASVALGYLQVMRDTLRSAKYLTSVSGGGFMAGAFVQALTPACPSETDATTVFAPGSVEEDHIRRHSSYLADTVPQLLLALGLVLRHLLLSLLVLFGPAAVVGVAAGAFYRAVPVVDLSQLDGKVRAVNSFSTPFPQPSVPAVIAGGTIALLAFLAWLASAKAPQFLYRLAIALGWIAAIFAVVVAVIPALIFGTAWILSQTNGVDHVAIGGPIGSVVLTYLATVASIAWRSRTTIATAVTKDGTESGKVQAAVPTGVVQRLLVAFVLLLLGLTWLMLFAGTALTSGRHGAWLSAGIVALAVLWFGGLADQTTLSLHPFFRKRIAWAFAVHVGGDAGTGWRAEGYDPRLRTSLASFGRTDEGFPAAVFSATANLNGSGKSPPGRTGVSYSFNCDWVGGPDVGWVRTDALQKLAPARIQRDLTVQGAVAISGGAFASAMGDGGRFYEVLLAVSGARLGAWMPNPRFVHQMVSDAKDDDWTTPRLPRVRRLDYLLREIANMHSSDYRLLEVTDGGHYENLGLVELLRRRCSTIYCVDASGDKPPTASTLAHALTVAHDELGVTFKFGDSPVLTDIEPGTGTPYAAPTLAELNARLSKSPLITGSFTYPPEGLPAAFGNEPRERSTKFVFAKAELWPDVPYDVLSHAAGHAVFPHDSTADQWFDADQFSAYTALGRALGVKARTA